jgi:hypothetical protein
VDDLVDPGEDQLLVISANEVVSAQPADSGGVSGEAGPSVSGGGPASTGASVAGPSIATGPPSGSVPKRGLGAVQAATADNSQNQQFERTDIINPAKTMGVVLFGGSGRPLRRQAQRLFVSRKGRVLPSKFFLTNLPRP